MAKMVSVKVECPGSVKHAQNGNIVAIPGTWSVGRYWPVGETYVDLDVAAVATIEGEIKRGESVLKLTRDVKPPAPKAADKKLDEITK